MKLCQLLHETSKQCPTCGGPVNAQGMHAKPSTELIFPDQEGIWHTPEGPKTAKDLETERPKAWKTQKVSPFEATPQVQRTKQFGKVLRPSHKPSR